MNAKIPTGNSRIDSQSSRPCPRVRCKGRGFELDHARPVDLDLHPAKIWPIDWDFQSTKIRPTNRNLGRVDLGPMNCRPLDRWQLNRRQLDRRNLDHRPPEGLPWRLRAWIARRCNRWGRWRDGRYCGCCIGRCSASCCDRCSRWRGDRSGDRCRVGDTLRDNFRGSLRDRLGDWLRESLPDGFGESGRDSPSYSGGAALSNNGRYRFSSYFANGFRNSLSNRFRDRVWNRIKNRVKNGLRNRLRNRFRNRFRFRFRNRVRQRIKNRVNSRIKNRFRNRFRNKLRNIVRECDRRYSSYRIRHGDSCRFRHNVIQSTRWLSPKTRSVHRRLALRPAQRPAAKRHAHPLQKDQVAWIAAKTLAAQKNLVRNKPRDAVRDPPAPRALGGIHPGSDRRCLCHTVCVPDRVSLETNFKPCSRA